MIKKNTCFIKLIYTINSLVKLEINKKSVLLTAAIFSEMTLKSTAGRRLSPHTRRLLCYAVASRLLVLALINTWRSLISPYDTSASINPPCLSATNSSSPPSSLLLPRMGSAIERSIVWDGVYFTRIAECGYEYEQNYAFLPLLPLCVSILSKSGFRKLISYFRNFIREIV